MKRSEMKGRVLASAVLLALLTAGGYLLSLQQTVAADEERAERPAVQGPWSRPSDREIKAMLTPQQYYVTQEDGTERAFDNAYWNNKEPGIYVDVVSGEPLFSSTDKFKSGTGWPSFTAPLEQTNIVKKKDWSWGMRRTEVRSQYGDSHLGHLFNDGPEPTGLRYCINSAALKFIPVAELEARGYGEYLKLFKR